MIESLFSFLRGQLEKQILKCFSLEVKVISPPTHFFRGGKEGKEIVKIRKILAKTETIKKRLAFQCENRGKS